MAVDPPPSSVAVDVPVDQPPPSIASVNASRPPPPLLARAPADPPQIATPQLGELGPNDPFFDQARLALVTISHVPQVIAVAWITPRLWSVDFNDGRCNRELSWVLIQAVFLVLSLANYWLWFWLVYWSERPPLLISSARRDSGISIATKTHAALYVFGLVWFMVGNALLLVIDADNKACGSDTTANNTHADTAGIHDVGLALLAMAYARVLWPCTLVLLGLPFLLLCRPCVLRYLSDPARDGMGFAGGGVPYTGSSRGATKTVIESNTQKVQFEKGMEVGAAVCCICLIDYDSGDKLRVLPCKHEFHQECVDEWLGRNATCPTCRKNIETNGARLDTAVEDVSAMV